MVSFSFTSPESLLTISLQSSISLYTATYFYFYTHTISCTVKYFHIQIHLFHMTTHLSFTHILFLHLFLIQVLLSCFHRVTNLPRAIAIHLIYIALSPYSTLHSSQARFLHIAAALAHYLSLSHLLTHSFTLSHYSLLLLFFY